MLRVSLEPEEINLAISAIENSRIMGKDAHLVSGVLRKFEDKIKNFIPVEEIPEK